MKKQTKQYLFGIVAFLVVLVGVQMISSSIAQVDPVTDAVLTISESSWDFGDISMADGIAVKEIPIENETASAITITSLETSCMCTTVQVVHSDGSKSGLKGMVGHGGTASMSETIQAGETATLVVRFDPNAHGPSATGPITRTIMMETNSQAQPSVTWRFSGNVIK